MLRQIDQQEPFSPIQQSILPQSPSRSKTQLSQLLFNLTKQQQRSMNTLSQKCSTMEQAITAIEVLVGKVGQRAQKLNQQKEVELLSSLKMKQYEFIVSELKGTLSKQTKKQERLIEQLELERKKVDKLREEVFKMEAKNNSLTEKVNRLDSSLTQKVEEISQLNQSIRKFKTELEGEIRVRVNSASNSEKAEPALTGEYYKDLESKLQQLQKQLESKVTTLENKNLQLSEQLRKMQDQYDQEKALCKTLKKQTEDLGILKYEQQIKLKKETQLNTDLEQSYNKLLQNSKTIEITLHKQIQDFKVKETTLRSQYKKEKKNFKVCLSNIAEFINNNTKYYIIATNINEQVEEIKKLHQKILRKKTEQMAREVQYQQMENKKLKIKIQELEKNQIQVEKNRKLDSNKLIRQVSQRESYKVEQMSGDKNDKKSEANSSFINRSTQKSQEELYKGVKEKYESKLDVFRKDLKTKQARINQLEKLQQTEFDKSKQKILQLELSVSQKVNEIRKLEMKQKQKEYQSTEHLNAIKQLQGKVNYMCERLESEKQASSKILQMKVQNYEQKIKNLKSNHKELERKEQQKTIKYNKLKNKFQKYEVEASQSLKRKNAQIDQLLKENSKLKTENKLLEEKINIHNIIQTEIKPKNINAKPELTVQIEAERIRINTLITEKQKELNQILEVNAKLSSQLLELKKQLKDCKKKQEETARIHRILEEQNKFAKQKIVEMSQKQEEQNKENHSYFKKQLEKSMAALKKTEKQSEKLAQEKQILKKQLEELQSQLKSVSTTCEKLKQNNFSLSNQVLQQKSQAKKIMADYQIKLAECRAKQSQLVDIINYKNRENDSNSIRQSMKGEELLLEEEQTSLKIDKNTSTDGLFHLTSTLVNTDEQKELEEKPIIPSEIILNDDFQFDQPLPQKSIKQENQIVKPEPVIKQVNYFNEQAIDNDQNNFDICEEGEEINIGQTAMNLQIKEVFNVLRKEIQKIFNQEDISIDVVKMLPKQLQDDFNDFMGYIKQKIFQIKNQNNLSFIMAQPGNQPEEVEEHIAQFLSKQSYQHLRLRKIIEEKDYMITSLMNQKTEQQNTINQLTVEKEEIQEENENRFMNQCNIYKREIRESKKIIDTLEMNCQSLKNIFKNTLQLWTEDADNEDDIRDNVVLFGTICRLNDNDKKKLNSCLQKYKKLKKTK